MTRGVSAIAVFLLVLTGCGPGKVFKKSWRFGGSQDADATAIIEKPDVAQNVDNDLDEETEVHPLSAKEVESIENPAPGARVTEKRALVVFNAGSDDAVELADYYVKQRKIPNYLACPVFVPESLYGSPDDLLSVRRQILETCLCPHFVDAGACGPENLTELLQNPEIPTHLVIIGLPIQLRWYPWPKTLVYTNDADRASFDFYLAHAVYSTKATCTEANCLFGVGSTGEIPDLSSDQRYGASFNTYSGSSGGLEPLSPRLHKAMAYGRIESLTVALAKTNQIDGALSVGITGQRGNFVGSSGPDLSMPYSLLRTFHDDDPDCLASLLNGGFPYQADPSCRVGWNYNGFPLTPNGNVRSMPRLGGFSNFHVGFDLPQHLQHRAFLGDIDKIRGFRLSDEECYATCDEFATETERAECRGKSSDPSRVLNTQCVGVTPGFVGFHLRSYDVQYMGLYPTGWQSLSAGPQTSTPPRLHEAGGYRDTRFVDDNYVSFGPESYRRTNDCLDAAGATRPCDPKVEVFIDRIFNLPAVQIGPRARRVRFSFAWKGYSAENRPLTYSLYLFHAGGQAGSLNGSVTVTPTSTAWRRATVDVLLSSTTPLTLTSATLLIASPDADGLLAETSPNRIPILGHVALDGFRAQIYPVGCGNKDSEGKDEGGESCRDGQDLIFATEGSFVDHQTLWTAAGDQAAQVQRMGAAAWSGSFSHHMTGGYAFSDQEVFWRAYTSGRTFGESLLAVGSGQSGVAFGDPLMQAGAAAIYFEGTTFRGSGSSSKRFELPLLSRSIPTLPESEFPIASTVVIFDDPVLRAAPIYFNASMGRGTEYQLEVCHSATLSGIGCAWTTILAGQEKVDKVVVPGTEDGVGGLATSGEGFYHLRLKVTGDPAFGEEALYARSLLYVLDPPTGPAVDYLSAFTVGRTDVPLEDIEAETRITSLNLPVVDVYCIKVADCSPERLDLKVFRPGIVDSGVFSILKTLETDGRGPFIRFHLNRPISNCTTSMFIVSSSDDLDSDDLDRDPWRTVVDHVKTFLGDANGDGYITFSDVLAIQAHVVSELPYREDYDLDGDGLVTVADVQIAIQGFGCTLHGAE